MIDCQWLHNQIDLHCHKVTSLNGSAGVCVQTNHKWLDGSLLSFYIIPQGEQLLITDDCDTLFHFHTTGLIEHKRSWKKIKDKLNTVHTDIALEDDGEILCITTQEKATYAIADYTSALCGLMHYERELAGIPMQVNHLADEVELYLKAWKPYAKFTRSPKVNGISGHSYTLDFQLDDQLIMAINPTPNAVGSVMRKAGDILSGNDLAGRKMLVVVDDRSDQLFEQKAEEEIQIIASLVKAVPLSRLIEISAKTNQIQ